MRTPSSDISRRLFVAHASAGAIAAALPWPILQSASAQSPPGGGPDGREVVIAGLTLQTSAPLAAMRRFYETTLGFAVVEASEQRMVFKCGESSLAFRFEADVDARYHFAFNIPSDRILAAHESLLRDGADFILPPPNLNDAGDPRAIVAFRHWNAHSVFFWDPAGNAVEYIARHDLPGAIDGAPGFSAASVERISEIGLVVHDVRAAAAQITTMLQAPEYVGASDAFTPIGSPHGLLLLMAHGRRLAFGQGSKRDVYPTKVELVREAPLAAALAKYPYALVAAAGR